MSASTGEAHDERDLMLNLFRTRFGRIGVVLAAALALMAGTAAASPVTAAAANKSYVATNPSFAPALVAAYDGGCSAYTTPNLYGSEQACIRQYSGGTELWPWVNMKPSSTAPTVSKFQLRVTLCSYGTGGACVIRKVQTFDDTYYFNYRPRCSLISAGGPSDRGFCDDSGYGYLMSAGYLYKARGEMLVAGAVVKTVESPWQQFR